MTGQTTPQPNTRPQQNFSSGRELIEAVITRREQATQARDLLASLENDLPSHPIAGDLVFGVFFTNRLAESGLFRSLFVKKTQYAGRRPGQTHFSCLTPHFLSFNPFNPRPGLRCEKEKSRDTEIGTMSRDFTLAEDVGFEPTRVVKPARVPGV